MCVCVCGAPVAESLKRALAVQKVLGSIPGRADAKPFALIGEFLNTSVCAGLSKDSGSILLYTRYKA